MPEIDKLTAEVKKTHNAIANIAIEYIDGAATADVLEATVNLHKLALKKFNKGTIRVFYWLDYTWCHESALDEMTSLISDDYSTLHVDLTLDDNDIDDVVRTRINEDVLVWTS